MLDISQLFDFLSFARFFQLSRRQKWQNREKTRVEPALLLKVSNHHVIYLADAENSEVVFSTNSKSRIVITQGEQEEDLRWSHVGGEQTTTNCVRIRISWLCPNAMCLFLEM